MFNVQKIKLNLKFFAGLAALILHSTNPVFATTKTLEYTVANVFTTMAADLCPVVTGSISNINQLERMEKEAVNYPEQQKRLQELKRKRLENLIGLGNSEAAIVAIHFNTPAAVVVQNLKTNFAGESFVRAQVSAPGAIATENGFTFPHPGMAAVQVRFTLMGLCPFVNKTDSNPEEAVEKALLTILK